MYGTYLRLNLHVGDSDRQVVKAARSKMMPHCRFDPSKRDARHQFYRAMLRHHHEARGLYRDVMYGEISE